MSAFDAGAVREALRHARAAGAGEIRLRAGEETFSATFVGAVASAPALEPETAIVEPGARSVRAGQVGYFHRSEPPLEPGARVEAQTILGIVEALGLANDVTAGAKGEFLGYLVEEGAAVEYGEVLAEVRA